MAIRFRRDVEPAEPGFVDIALSRCRISFIVRLATIAFPRLFRVESQVALIAFAVTLCAALFVQAKSEAPATDIQVQKIYGEAKAAEAGGDLAAAAASYKSLVQLAPHLGP